MDSVVWSDDARDKAVLSHIGVLCMLVVLHKAAGELQVSHCAF